MRGRVKITTGFPSVTRTAKKLGISKEVAERLYKLAEDSRRTGEFVMPGVGRLVRGKVKARKTPQTVHIPAKAVVKFRVQKTLRNEIVPPKKKRKK